MVITVRCPGKVILFGEHAVCYGQPALATTISLYTKVVAEGTVEPCIVYKCPQFDYNRSCKVSILDEVESVTDEESDLRASQKIRAILDQKESFREESWFILLCLYHKIVPADYHCGITVTATTDLHISSGLGSSASFCACLALSLLTLTEGDTSRENVDRLALYGEKVFHGNPSGVDNTLCVYGGSKLYTPSSTNNNNTPSHTNTTFTDIPSSSTPRLIIINSKIKRSTRDIVTAVGNKRGDLEEVFTEIGEIVYKGVESLREGEDIGELIERNHVLLNKLPLVKNEAIDRIVSECRRYGVPAKVTGAGGGGCVLGLVREGVNVEGLTLALTKLGFVVSGDVKIGVGGVEVMSKVESGL